MSLADLIHRTDDALRECVRTMSEHQIEDLFKEIWSGIRKKSLYGGQPSSDNSNQGLQLARLALELATHAGTSKLMVEAWCMLAYTLNANEHYSESLEYYRLAIEGLEKAHDEARAARTRLGYVTALSMVGRSDEAIEVGLLAQRFLLSVGDNEGYARACVNLGNVYQRLDQPADGLQYQEKAIQYFTGTNNEPALGQVYLNSGNSLGLLGRFEEADHSYALSEQICERLGLNDLLV